MNLCNKTVKDILLLGKKILKCGGIEQFSLDAELLLMKQLKFTKIQLFTKDRDIVSQKEIKEYFGLIEERLKGVPTQYILGRCEFMGLDFLVNPHVLIPRPDTEILVERVLSFKDRYDTFIDMCTGSGCIAVSLAKYGGFTGWGVDISSEALQVAEKNALENNVSENIKFIKSNVFNDIKSNMKTDIIVSNPPYIETETIKTLTAEVKDNEPYIALDGGSDGLDFYREIAEKSIYFLNENGGLFFEIGFNQGESVEKIMEKIGFKDIKIEKDLAGLDRVVFGFKK